MVTFAIGAQLASHLIGTRAAGCPGSNAVDIRRTCRRRLVNASFGNGGGDVAPGTVLDPIVGHDAVCAIRKFRPSNLGRDLVVSVSNRDYTRHRAWGMEAIPSVGPLM